MVSKNMMSYLKTPNLLKILEKIETRSRAVTIFLFFFGIAREFFYDVCFIRFSGHVLVPGKEWRMEALL
jgi:hypothetical protein